MAKVRSVTTSTTGAGSTARTVAMPAAQPGDVLAIVELADNDATLAKMVAPDGLAEVYAWSGQYVTQVKVWARTVDGDEPAAYVFNRTPGAGGPHEGALVAFALYEVDMTTLVVSGGTGATAQTGDRTALSVPSVTGLVNGLQVVMGAAMKYAEADIGLPFWSPPSGFTEHLDMGGSWLKPWSGSRPLSASGATGAVTCSPTSGTTFSGGCSPRSSRSSRSRPSDR